jgi:hypothetical protein
MAYYDLEGRLVYAHDGNPIEKGKMKLSDIVSLASEAIKDRIAALNFEPRTYGSVRVFFLSHLPGSPESPSPDAKSPFKSLSVFLPHTPAADGLWSNDLAASRQIDLCSVLPQIEQHLRFSADHVVLFRPSPATPGSDTTVNALELYKNQILDLYEGILKEYSQINALCFGIGGAALTLAMSAIPELRNRIHKISFVECEETVSKTLADTVTTGDFKERNVWQASPVARLLERRAIMFKLDDSPIGSILKDGKDAGCSCPVVSIGTKNPEEVMFQGGAMGIAFFRKSSPSISKALLAGIGLLILVLLAVLFLLSSK